MLLEDGEDQAMTDHEREVLADASLDEPWSLLEAFAEIVREHPTEVNRAADLLIGRLERHGIPVTVYEPELYLSLPKDAEVRAAKRSFRAKPPSASASAPDGIEAELCYVPAQFARGAEDVFGTVSREALKESDICGKIVLTEGFAMPANVSQCEALGAVALIAINPGQDIHWGTCTTIWGIPDLRSLERRPTIPAVAVNRPDGEELKALAQAGERVTVTTLMEEGWFSSKLPVVTIPGSVEPERFVLLHGHYDSWDIGIGDNATGDATMLEVARVLWRYRDALRRSVRIAWWPGHSTGRYAGSTWFSDTFALDLEENCVAQVNCDSPGCRWATEYKNVSLMPETEAFAARVIRDVSGQALQAERPHRAGDYSFNNIGISGYFMLLSTMPDDLRIQKGYYGVGGCGGNIAWHTENDRLIIADRDVLLTDIKIYLLAVLRNATAEVLPFDWRATALELSGTVERYQRAAGEHFDLSATRAAVDELRASLEAFYGAVESRAVAAADANDVILELARLLVPANYTREPRFWHDPALTIPPLPDLSVATELGRCGEGELGFATTELMRGQNRVVSTLRQARRRVEGALP